MKIDIKNFSLLDFEKGLASLSARLKKPGDFLKTHQRQSVIGFFLVFISYLCASIASSVITTELLDATLRKPVKVRTKQANFSGNLLKSDLNYRDLKKVVLNRNLFNSDGEFPDEKDPEKGGGGGKKVFDAKGPCQNTSLPIELLGTISIGNGRNSLATVKDKGYSEADIYRVGEKIIGNDQALIYAINRNEIILNNSGVKECIQLKDNNLAKSENGSEDAPTLPEDSGKADQQGSGDSGATCMLESAYVEKELGPGFGKIVNSARLVPNTVDNAVNGFKIFAIKGESLFSKIGLQNGDIITQVNDTSLKQPEQGFALYQAFLDEREVRILILRGGKTPKTITCRIK